MKWIKWNDMYFFLNLVEQFHSQWIKVAWKQNWKNYFGLVSNFNDDMIWRNLMIFNGWNRFWPLSSFKKTEGHTAQS